jgi:hypothetical protein
MRWQHLGRIGRTAGLACTLTVAASSLPAQAGFLRGDPDESGGIEITDAIRILHFLFLGQGDAIRCRDAADADDGGAVDLADALHLLNGLFLGGPAPPPPFPGCGVDPTEDGLDCARYEACRPATVQFFGIEFEAQGLFFVVDRSGNFTPRGELDRAKQEVVATIASLTEDFEFAVLFTDRGLIRWPVNDAPARATEENKVTAMAWVNGAQGGSGSCDQPGLLRAVGYAGQSSVSDRAVFYVSNGGGTCSGEEAQYHRETIDAVTAANSGTARIHSIQVNSIGDGAEAFMRELAEKNGGTFHQLNHP